MTVTVRCPCGRKVSHPVVAEGGTPPPIYCDAECERRLRTVQLADAFGVDDRERPPAAAAFSGGRAPTYGAELLWEAKQALPWVHQLEGQLADFVIDRGSKRCSLRPMTRAQRKVCTCGVGEVRML